MKLRLIAVFSLLIVIVLVYPLFSRPVDSQSSSVTLGAWQATPEFGGQSNPYPSFARDGYYYVHTNNSSRDVYFSRPNTDGSITSWQKAWDDHGGIHGFTAVVVDGTPFHFRNGHIARYPFNSDGTVNGDVELLENSLEGSFDGRLWVWDTAVYAPLTSGKYVYHLGGFSCPGSGCGVSYQYNGDIFMSSVPIGSEFTNTGKEHPEDRPGKSVFYAPNGGADYGYIYTKGNQGNNLYKIRVNSGGGLGNWESVGDLPSGTGNNRGDLFVIGNTLFTIRGSKVFSSDLNPQTGALSGWSDTPPDLPEEQVNVTWGGEQEGATWGVIGNYVYVTGPRKVYFAQINGGGQNPTATTVPGQPTATTVPGQPTATTAPNQPTATPTTPVVSCDTQKKQGNFNCTGAVDEADFTAWKESFNAKSSSLSFFEYWRRTSLP